MSQPANILLVDDRIDNLVALEATLEPLGHPLVRAMSGPEALKQLLTEDYAVILMDVQMPGMDGFETASIIKQREKSRYIPIIFITALSTDQENVFKGYFAGAVDYISKPFQPEILKSKVQVFIDLFEKGEQIKHQAELLRQSEQREAEARSLQLATELEQKHMAEIGMRQHVFLRDVLASVTEGRLLLRASRQELPAPLPVSIAEVALNPPGAIRDLRVFVQDAARIAGLSDQRWQDLVSAVSEAAMNAVVHAAGGVGRVYIDPTGMVQVWIEDNGDGISLENIPRATLERGYTTAGTMGHGFWMMLETVDRIYLNTGPEGTVIVLEQQCTRPLPPWLRD